MTITGCNHGDDFCYHKIEQAIENIKIGYRPRLPIKLIPPSLVKHAKEVHKYPEDIDYNCLECWKILACPFI